VPPARFQNPVDLSDDERGFRFVAVGSDHGIVREGAAAQVKALKG